MLLKSDEYIPLVHWQEFLPNHKKKAFHNVNAAYVDHNYVCIYTDRNSITELRGIHLSKWLEITR